MPKSNYTITEPLRGALIECFRATTRLVRPELRRQLVLVGDAASIAHSSEAISAGAPNFSLESDGKTAFDAPQGFRVRIDLIQIGDGCIQRIYVAEPFHEGSVASKSDLLRLRAVTVVDRGSDGEVDDFRWLLSGVASEGQVLPVLDKEELEYVMKAGGSCLGKLDRLVLGAVLGANNSAIAYQLISS
ncbi:hypothetical protein OEA41_002575 [Lepraria neglecta]|uniref:Uncharacterized protein n=1 Tax=Lepraria neglecta TaxID=209136 RepID=A0AAD9ZCM8_9LECA|nr:hypothetical protein OEA41_002575 [Lepraria neglecta]